MARARKSIAEAYLFWFFLGPLGGHRFYLGRPMMGISFAVLTIAGAALYITGVQQELTKRQFAGVLIVGLAITGMIVDFVMIPRLVDEYNNPPDNERSFVRPGASLDPSFQATERLVQIDDETADTAERARKPSIPKDYEMPWRKAPEKDEERYKPGQD